MNIELKNNLAGAITYWKVREKAFSKGSKHTLQEDIKQAYFGSVPRGAMSYSRAWNTFHKFESLGMDITLLQDMLEELS